MLKTTLTIGKFASSRTGRRNAARGPGTSCISSIWWIVQWQGKGTRRRSMLVRHHMLFIFEQVVIINRGVVVVQRSHFARNIHAEMMNLIYSFCIPQQKNETKKANKKENENKVQCMRA